MPGPVQGGTQFSADASSVPLFGSIFAGVVMAFLVTCLLLSIYMAYMATPEGASSYMFFEPRGLIVSNGIVTFASTHTIEQNFASCSSDAAGATATFVLFCCMACWLDALVDVIRGRVDARKETVARMLVLFRYGLMQSMALVPVIGFLATHASHAPSIVLVRMSSFFLCLVVCLSVSSFAWHCR